MTDEQAQPTLLESMEAAFDELSEEPAEEATAVETPQASIPDPEAVEAEADAGEELSADDQTEDTETGDDQPLAAPEHWSDEDKGTFAALDPEGQAFLLRRHREMEADYTRKTQEIAEQRKAVEPLEKVLAPHRALWQQYGLDDAGAISRLINAEQSLRANPVQGVLQIAASYGVKRDDLFPDDTTQSDYVDPQTQQLQQRIDQLENLLQQQGTNQYMTQQQAIQSQIDSFANAKDASGEPAHPHFSAVENRMAALIAAERQLGNQLSLEDAYKQAVQLDPAIREQVTAAQRRQQEAELERKAAERAAKARRAAKAQVRSVGAGSPAAGQPEDLKESLKQTWAELGG